MDAALYFFTALLAFLLLVEFLKEWRVLYRAGAEHPVVLILKRTLGRVLGPVADLVSRGADPLAARKLLGRPVWIFWDVRWSSYGINSGKLRDVLPREDGEQALLIQLSRPIKVYSGTNPVRINAILFEPSAGSLSPLRYRMSSVRGKIVPAGNPEEFARVLGAKHLVSCRVAFL
ncbi:MAG: hypothetical protein P8Y66_08965 [Nitrospirota bacterium]